MRTALLIPLALGSLPGLWPLAHQTALSTTADTLPAAALATADSLVASWVATGRVPGAVLLVSQDGRTLLERAYGSAEAWAYGDGQYGAWLTSEPTGRLGRLERPVAMEVGTVFDLASLTKVMATTFAVMALVDDGALDLDAPVSAVLPDFRGGAKDALTPRQLLTHTAGLEPWLPVYYHAANADEAYAFVRDLPLASAPGEGRRYSDLGFMLLGRIVERVASRPLDAFLRERFYQPLRLTHTGFRPAGGEQATAPAGIAATSHGNPYEYRMVHDSTFGYRIEGDARAWDGWRRRTLRGEVNDGNAFHAFDGVAGHAGLF
jgi:CubicO group peptidase (beta-lactamase class C family)